MSKAKHILSSAIARCIVADAKRKGKRPPPFEGTRALVERQGWRKIIRLTAKCFLLLPLQRLCDFNNHVNAVGTGLETRDLTLFQPFLLRMFARKSWPLGVRSQTHVWYRPTGPSTESKPDSIQYFKW